MMNSYPLEPERGGRGVAIRYGEEPPETVPLAYPDPTYGRVDVVGYDTRWSPPRPLGITGPPGHRLRLPPLPPGFVPLGYVQVRPLARRIVAADISADPDPAWEVTP